MVVVSDGRFDDEALVPAALAKWRKKGIEILVIGIGPLISK